MSSKTKLTALAVTIALLLTAVAPAAAGGMVAANDAGNDDGDVANEEDGDVANEEADDDGVFGQQVSAFVHELMNSTNETDQALGQQISEWVTANNPGADKRPDHAGPPEDRGPDRDENDTERGPPEDRGPDGDQGPPEDRGPDSNDDEDGDDDKTRRGPP